MSHWFNNERWPTSIIIARNLPPDIILQDDFLLIVEG